MLTGIIGGSITGWLWPNAMVLEPLGTVFINLMFCIVVPTNLTDGNKETYWGTNDGDLDATITLTWDEPQVIRYLVMQEPIKLGQRIKDFKIEYTTDGTEWTELCPVMQTTTVGYKRIIPLNGKTNESYGNGYKAKQLRITILDSRACPLLSNLNVY